MKILLDTNVVLDLLLAREPFVACAREIFILIENSEIEGYLCANSVTTLHYLIGREKNKKEADEIISELLSLFEVTPVSKNPTLEGQVLITPLRGYNAFHLKGVRATVLSVLT